MDKKEQKQSIISIIMNWCDVHSGFVFCGLSFFVMLVVVCFAYYSQSSLDEIFYNYDSGFYDKNLLIEIKKKKWFANNGEIKYNLNGDDLESSSDRYEGPIILEVPETGYKVYTMTAAVCFGDNNCGERRVATYILGKNLKQDITLDIVSINSSHDGLYDHNYGIMVGGKTYDRNIELELDYTPGNYNNRGVEWNRDAFLTVFNTDGYVSENCPIKIEISGGTSASYDVKSIEIETIDQSLFQGFGSEFNYSNLRLRSGSQDHYAGNIRSSVVGRLIKESGLDFFGDTKRTIVFLNGIFYGIFDLQINYSEKNIANRYGINNYKMIERYKKSETMAFEQIRASDVLKNDLDNSNNRDALEKIIDMDSYLNYYALQILWNNTDWPMNNYGLWRYNGTQASNNEYEDGRARFMIYDTDLVYYSKDNVEWFDGAISDIFVNLMEDKYNGAGSSFRNVMKSNYYREKFISILRSLINGPFKTDNVLAIIDEEKAKIDYQMRLFYDDEECQEWEDWIDSMKKAAGKRESEVRADAKKYFGVDL